MKMKNVLAAIAFMVAVGSALAFKPVSPVWTDIAEVPGQGSTCVSRNEDCTGGSTLCKIEISPDVFVQAYDGTAEDPGDPRCGDMLKRN